MTITASRRLAARLGIVLGALALARAAAAADPAAVLTELRPGTGEIQVRRAAEGAWAPALPLLALRPGDQVRATGPAQAVLVFTGGGVQTVSAANSPFVVPAPRARSGAANTQALVAGVVQFLLGQQKEPRYEQLSVRGPSIAPRILAPRESRLRPGPVLFEWMGGAAFRYQVKLVGPEGVVWEQDGLPRQPLAYPAIAPPLRPGASYRWTLTAPGQPVQQATFELVTEAEAARIAGALAALQPAALAGYPPTTATVMRVGLLVQERLYAEARRELLAALAAEPAAPSLRQLLGLVYERTGLEDLAGLEFDEAGMLSRPRS
jgi:hypothetical protein